MVRLLAYSYVIRGPQAEKSLAVDLAVGLMRAITPLAERAARLPAGPSNPGCNAGVSFTALRDASALPPDGLRGASFWNASNVSHGPQTNCPVPMIRACARPAISSPTCTRGRCGALT